MPTNDQTQSLIRQFLMIAGGVIGAWFARKGILSADDLSFFAAQGPVLVGLAMAVGGAIWGIIAHRQANMVAVVAAMPDKKVDMVAAVAAMPDVKKVETTNTPEGAILAAAANTAAGPTGTVTVAKV